MKYYTKAKAWVHTKQREKAISHLESQIGTDDTFSAKRVFEYNLEKQIKRPAEIDGAELSALLKGEQDANKDEPPITIQFPEINPDPTLVGQSNLVNRFDLETEAQMIQYQHGVSKLGGLIFSDKYEDYSEDKRECYQYKEELFSLENDKNLDDSDKTTLMREFERETGKNALWGGRITKNYIKWLEKNIQALESQLDSYEASQKSPSIKSNIETLGLEKSRQTIFQNYIGNAKEKIKKAGNPQESRFINKWGTLMIGPNFYISGVDRSLLNEFRAKEWGYDKNLIKSYEAERERLRAEGKANRDFNAIWGGKITENYEGWLKRELTYPKSKVIEKVPAYCLESNKKSAVSDLINEIKEIFFKRKRGVNDFALVLMGNGKTVRIPSSVKDLEAYSQFMGIDLKAARIHLAPAYLVNTQTDIEKGKGVYKETEVWLENDASSPNKILLENFKDDLMFLLNKFGMIENAGNFQGLELLLDPGKRVLSNLLNRLNNNKQFSFLQGNFDKWLSRIIREISLKVENGEITEDVKLYQIDRVKNLFNEYSFRFGFELFGDVKRLFRKEARLAVAGVATILFDYGLIKSDLPAGIADSYYPSIYFQYHRTPSYQKAMTLKQGTLDFIDEKLNLEYTIGNANNLNQLKEQIKREVLLFLEPYIGCLPEPDSLMDSFLNDMLSDDEGNELDNSKPFADFLASSLRIIDPKGEIFNSREEYSEFLFRTKGYIWDSLAKNNRPEPQILYYSILQSYRWQNEKGFNKEMGERYRQLVKEWMFSNPKGFTFNRNYVAENDKGFKTHTFDKLMRLRYDLQLHLYISTLLHAEDESLSLTAFENEDIFNTQIFSTLLIKTSLTSENYLSDALARIAEWTNDDISKWLKNKDLKLLPKLEEKISFYAQTYQLLLEYDNYIREIQKKMSEFWGGGADYTLGPKWDMVSQGWDRLMEYIESGSNRKRIMDGIKNEYIYELKEDIEKILGLSVLSHLSLTGMNFHWNDPQKREIKTDWINRLQNEGFFSVYEEGGKNEGIPDAIKTLMDDVKSLKKLDENYFYKHGNIEKLLNEKYGLCAENPLYQMFKKEDTGKKRYWFGQSDLTLLDGDTLYVIDFKPEKGIDAGRTSEHFVNAFLQTIGYALSTKVNVDEELKVKGVVFNGDGEAVVFDPIEMFAEIQKFMSGKFEHSSSKLLGDYKEDMDMKPEHALFFNDFRQLIDKILEGMSKTELGKYKKLFDWQDE